MLVLRARTSTYRALESINAFKSKRKIDVKLLEGAILNLLKHHDALRFRYEQLPNGTWRQRNEGTDELSVLHVVKRNQVNEKEWNKIIQEEMNIHQASFNLITGPLMKVVYFEDNLTENDEYSG